MRLSPWFYVRLIFREFVRAIILIDLFCLKIVQKIIKPRYELHGECHKRGVCCQQILGDPPRWIKQTRLLQLFAVYHKVFHNFTAVARGPNDEVIFSCGHLQSDGRCGIYRYRPRLCRNYPVLPFFEAPKLMPGCGYIVVPRGIALAAKTGGRASLRILNATPAVHHPTPDRNGRRPGQESHDDYHLVDWEK